MKTQACFVNTDNPPENRTHICYFSKLDGMEVKLYEVEKLTYPHPEQPHLSSVELVHIRFVKSELVSSFDGAALMLLYYAENNAQKVIE